MQRVGLKSHDLLFFSSENRNASKDFWTANNLHSKTAKTDCIHSLGINQTMIILNVNAAVSTRNLTPYSKLDW